MTSYHAIHSIVVQPVWGRGRAGGSTRTGPAVAARVRSIYLSKTIYLSIFQSIHPSIYLSLYLSISLCLSLSMSLSLSTSLSLFLSLSIPNYRATCPLAYLHTPCVPPHGTILVSVDSIIARPESESKCGSLQYFYIIDPPSRPCIPTFHLDCVKR